MPHEVQGEVTFFSSAHLEGFDKYNEKFCFLVLSGNDNLPKKISISKSCFEDNYASCLKKAKGNEKWDISFKGRIKQRNGRFFFNVSGEIELIPTAKWTEEEIDDEIAEFFSPLEEE